MKKTISIILFIVLARFCDGQILMGQQTIIIPSGIIVRNQNATSYSPCFTKYTDTTFTTILWRWNPSFLGAIADTMKASPKRVILQMSNDEGLGWTIGQVDTFLTKYPSINK